MRADLYVALSSFLLGSAASTSADGQLGGWGRPAFTLAQPHHGTRWLARPSRRRATGPPELVVGDGVELKVHQIEGVGASIARRAVNGTDLYLGEDLTTYVVPVNIGSPSITYPLQLDLGSSDLLLASTLCHSNCPQSLGPSINPYYDVSVTSTTFQAIQANTTGWSSSFADGSRAAGLVIEDQVMLGKTVTVDSQIIGLINSTNLTLATQQISGIVGLGFPRLSALSHAVFARNENSNTTTYYPPLMENLVTQPRIPYPVFGLALAPPPNATVTSNTGAVTATGTPRYQPSIGSLTLGGVSSQYVVSGSAAANSVGNIEWHGVVPFGRSLIGPNVTAVEVTGTSYKGNSAMATSAAGAGSSITNSTASVKRMQARAYPHDLSELGEEEYLYWTLNLRNISVNGTAISPTSTYASIGLQSIALLDAGTNGIYGPQQDVEAIFRQIPDARQSSTGQWIVPCDTRMTLGFSFGGRYIQLQPSDWIYAGIVDSEFCLAWPVATPSTGDGIDWQLGTPFLRKSYSIFSYGINGGQAPMIGFLPINASGSGTETDGSRSPTPTTVAPLSITTTLNIPIPNALLPDPNFATPSYVYSAQPTLLTVGATQTIGLANASAYSISDIPIVEPPTNYSSLISLPTTGYGGGGNSVTPTSGAVVRQRIIVPWFASLLGLCLISETFRTLRINL